MDEENVEIVEIKPQLGFQTKVAMSKADITLMGGAAGCGKSFIMLYIPLMYKSDPNLRVDYFRRTQKMIRESGALWDESMKLYPAFGASPSESILKWRFPDGAIIDFVGIEYEKDLINFQGAQIPLMLFDELTQFTKKQFFFMISRNRGIFKRGKAGYLQKPQVFASCNPDPDSWVATLVEWYIDPETGLPIPERDGIIRFFIVTDDVILWGNSKAELIANHPEKFQDPDFLKSGLDPNVLIKSFTFIGGKIYDNKKLLETNPGYLGSLMSQSDADQDRFLKGNWKVRANDTGLYKDDAVDKIFIETVSESDFTISGWDKDKPTYELQRDYTRRFITCDAAKFGRDLCVIFVWDNWTIVHITIFYLSSPEDIHKEIELLRSDREFGVLQHNVCVDQDGVGGDVVQLGGYYGFVARRTPAIETTNRQKENYGMRKDQCFYHSAARVNAGEVKCILLDSTIKIYDKGARKPRWSRMMFWNKEKINVKVLIKKQLRAIKRGDNVDLQGGDIKLTVNTKDQQKEILGHSPDFADNFMMREDLELRTKRSGGFNVY